MDVSATFLPVAIELIDQAFPTPIVYNRAQSESYDPATGLLTRDIVGYAINAGILGLRKSEKSGSEEVRELRLWVHHGPGGLPHEPTTGDLVEYGGETWRVTEVVPTFTAAERIASKITCEFQHAHV